MDHREQHLNKCRTCRYWVYTGRFGNCGIVADEMAENLACVTVYHVTLSGVWKPNDDAHYRGTLTTDAEFGCLHWEYSGTDLLGEQRA